MKIYQKNRDTIIDELEDFNIEQTMECGQCFHFEKVGDNEYGIVSLSRFIHVKQENNMLICYNISADEVESYWLNYFDLNRDYGKIKKYLLNADGKLKTAMEDKYGVRILNQEFVETLMSFIISQNKQITQIKQIVRRISMEYGRKIGEIGDVEFYSFPDRELLGRITEEEYKDMRTGFRAKYLRDASIKLNDGTISENIVNMNYTEAAGKLMEIKGVGEKVANCVLLFGLGHREVFPVDVWIKRIMESMYFDDEDTSKEKIMEFARQLYGEYGGYAQQYLFYYGRENNMGKMKNQDKKSK